MIIIFIILPLLSISHCIQLFFQANITQTKTFETKENSEISPKKNTCQVFDKMSNHTS